MSRMRPPQRGRSARARGRRFVILAASFNHPIAEALVRAAADTLRRHGARPADIRVVWVPGAFELPLAAARALRRRPRPDGLIAVGALIRGHTSQYLVLAHAVAQGLMQVAVRQAVPVGFGVIIAERPAQARARAGRGAGNRGAEAADAVVAMLPAAGKDRST